MRRLKFLFRPGWLVLAAVVGIFAFMCFTVLAPWQLGKNTATSHRNDLIASSAKAAPVPLEQLLHGGHGSQAGIPKNDEWRRVTVTGHYLPDKQVLLRLQEVQDSPAYEVIAPFRTSDGAVVLVDRGYVRPTQNSQPPPVAAPPSGTVTLEARVRAAESTPPGKSPVESGGWTQVYSIDPGTIGAVTGLQAIDNYLQLGADQPGGLGVIGLPQLDSGPYLSYGLQWIAFGVMAPLGLGYFVWSEIRERRSRRAEEVEETAPGHSGGPSPNGAPATAEAAGGDPAPSPAPASEPEPEDDDLAALLHPRRRPFSRGKATAAGTQPRTAVDAKLADRYGDQR